MATLIYRELYSLHQLVQAPVRIANALLRRLHVPLRMHSPVPVRFQQDPGIPSFLVYWGLAQVMQRYEIVESGTELARTAT